MKKSISRSGIVGIVGIVGIGGLVGIVVSGPTPSVGSGIVGAVA